MPIGSIVGIHSIVGRQTERRNTAEERETNEKEYLIQTHQCKKGAGTSEASGQTKEKLWVNDTSRHPKVLKGGPNYGCQ